MINFTLVSTVLNEATRLDQTIRDLSCQTLQPSEIIITDAGSTDGTFASLIKWQGISSVPIVLFQRLGCNVAEGRNLAIQSAKTDLIASMDFGCRYQPDWLKSLMTPFNNADIDVVGGAYSVDEADILSKAAKGEYILNNGYLKNINLNTFIPSSRSIAFRKVVYNEVGGYCEWLTLAADDMVFGMLVRKLGYSIFVVSDIHAIWMRHETALGYVKESFRYGLGNGEANIQYKGFVRMVLRKVSWVLLLSCLILIGVDFIFFDKVLIIPSVVVILLGFLFKRYLSYFRNWLRLRSLKYDIYSLIYAYILDVRTSSSYIRGYIRGYFFATRYQKAKAKELQKRLRK